MYSHTRVWTFDGKTTDITIRLVSNDDRTEVCITRGTHFGETGQATINWPGCGAQGTEVTDLFIEMLQTASKIAHDLDDLSPDEFAATDEVDAERMVANHIELDKVYAN